MYQSLLASGHVQQELNSLSFYYYALVRDLEAG
jgi:hypothetical protein